MLRIVAIIFLVTHFFQAFQGLDKLLLRSDSSHSSYHVNTDTHRTEQEKSGQTPPAENMPADVETMDADTENDALDEFVPLHQNFSYRKFNLLTTPSATARLKDQLQLELLCPPPEQPSFA